MTPTLRAVASTVAAGAVALGAVTAPAVMAGALLVAIVIFAVGWPRLVGLPTYRGPAVVVGGTGVAAVVVCVVAPPHTLGIVMGLAVVAAFFHQMLRRDGRPRLVESISGVVAGETIVVAAAQWIAVDAHAGYDTIALVGALALAVAVLATALPLSDPVSAVLATALAAGIGLLLGWQLPLVGIYAGAVVGGGVGIITAALHILFGRFPGAGRRMPALAAAMTPVLVAAVPVYLATGFLTS